MLRRLGECEDEGLVARDRGMGEKVLRSELTVCDRLTCFETIMQVVSKVDDVPWHEQRNVEDRKEAEREHYPLVRLVNG